MFVVYLICIFFLLFILLSHISVGYFLLRCVAYLFLCFFFCKQKTAYEMRISDWSSDVCSSDLPLHPRSPAARRRRRPRPARALQGRPHVLLRPRRARRLHRGGRGLLPGGRALRAAPVGAPQAGARRSSRSTQSAAASPRSDDSSIMPSRP